MQVLEKSSLEAPSNPRGASKTEAMSMRVREETLDALVKAQIIRPEEKDGFQNYLVSNSINTGEILPVMAQLRGIEEGEQVLAVSNWARAMTPIVKKRYSLVPFASRLLGTSSLFENYATIREAASLVKCPLIFAEDVDVLGFGTINPVAGACLSEFVSAYLNQQTGVSPYISMFLLDLPSWEAICRRQFEQ